MLHKVILGGIVTAVIIIAAIGLFVVLGESEKITINDKSTNQKPYVPRKLTLELSDGINMSTGP